MLPTFGSAVASGKGQVQVRFAYELEARRVPVPGYGFNEGRTQGYDAGRVAFGGVEGFFAPQVVLSQHSPDHAQAHGLPTLGNEQGPGRRVQAARPPARRRLGGPPTARLLAAQELGHER